MALTAQIIAQIVATETLASAVSPAAGSHTVKSSFTLTNGTGANQADRIWSSQRTLAASTGEDIDLSGVLLNLYGAAATFVRIKCIIVMAATGNTNNVVVGGAATNQFVGPFGAATHTIAVKPGGFFASGCADAAGFTVTGATGDLLKVLNGGAGTSVVYDICIVGCSA